MQSPLQRDPPAACAQPLWDKHRGRRPSESPAFSAKPRKNPFAARREEKQRHPQRYQPTTAKSVKNMCSISAGGQKVQVGSHRRSMFRTPRGCPAGIQRDRRHRQRHPNSSPTPRPNARTARIPPPRAQGTLVRRPKPSTAGAISATLSKQRPGSRPSATGHRFQDSACRCRSKPRTATHQPKPPRGPGTVPAPP